MSSKFGPMTLVVNERSGRGAVGKALPTVESHLKQRELEYEIVRTQGPGDAVRLTREALLAGRRFIVAVGGDGTVHEVVNGMIEKDKPVVPDPVLGVIGAGSGCDFIKTFGIPGMPAHAVAHLDGEEAFPIDIGKVTFSSDGEVVTRYFANIAEAGLGAAAVKWASRLPRFLGPTMYFFSFWLAMARHKGADGEVDLVDRTYRGRVNNMVVANGQFFGGGMKVAPKAVPTDALFDIQIEHASKRDVIAMLPKVYKGEHISHPDVEVAKRVRVSIDTDPPILIEADGELLGHTPASFEVLKDLIFMKV